MLLADQETETQKKVVSWAESPCRPSWDCQHLMSCLKHRANLLKPAYTRGVGSCGSPNGSHEERCDHAQQEFTRRHKRGSTQHLLRDLEK